MIYKVFIDDSGKKEYPIPYSREFTKNPPVFKDYEDFWRNNYFVICGVRIKQDDLDEINKEINQLKKDTFGTKDVEIKSDWLRNPNQRKKHYLDVFGISDEKLNTFGEKFLDLIPKYKEEMKLIGVVFDKRFYGDEKRQSGEGSPLLKTTQVLFERLQYASGYNVVIFDQMESSLRLDIGKHDKILKVFQKNVGMEKIYVDTYTKVVDIKFEQSKSENFLQIADICAYNIFRQFVEYGREWRGEKKDETGKSSDMDTYKHFDKIRCNFMFHTNYGEMVARGCGLTCIPDKEKLNWNILGGCFEDKKTP